MMHGAVLLVHGLLLHGAFLGVMSLALTVYACACAPARAARARVATLAVAVLFCLLACAALEWARVRWLGQELSLARWLRTAAPLCVIVGLLWVVFLAAGAVSTVPRRGHARCRSAQASSRRAV